ncbi:hypothetical protein ACL02T_10940 [Pseudonocardia sp. RS010]|uniref:hypothetical protein n=1 Tax=Pseudonocardia sp. RS010 TaxID=3385979 RepID=UPI0039A15C49
MLPGPAGSGWADALAALAAAGVALSARFGLGTMPVWRAAVALSAGRLLAPSWPAPGDQR